MSERDALTSGSAILLNTRADVLAMQALPAPPVIVSNAFGLVVSGRPLVCEFTQLDATHFVVAVASPATAAELTVFFLPAALAALPPDAGVVVFASAPGGGYTTLGALTRSCPSTVIRTGWPTNPEVAGQASVQLGLAVEPLANVANVAGALSRSDGDRLAFAQLVAMDLFVFLSSFAQPTPVGDRLLLPPDAVDRWMRKFTERFRHDPNFLLKRTDG